MPTLRIRKGLDIPITGEPEQSVSDGPAITRVAVYGAEFNGMKPRMICAEGDTVARGQPLFEDRKTPGVLHTAPGAGRVLAIQRGAKRALQSVVIELSEAERAGDHDAVAHHDLGFAGANPAGLDADAVRNLLLASGAWTLLRTRPYGRAADPSKPPAALFVNCMDTRPLAPSPDVVLKGNEAAFADGLTAVSKLTSGPVHMVKAVGSAFQAVTGVELSEASGPHPAGLVGTHIHMLFPVNREKIVWYLDYEAVIAIGHLLRTGRVSVERVVSLAGPPVASPRLLRTRDGASIDELTAGAYAGDAFRVISGSVLTGRAASGDVHGWLGRHDRQVSVLAEDTERVFVGWLRPGADRFSTVWAYLGGLIPGKRFAFTTTSHGEEREMVPIGMYERVMPLDILPTFLLRSMLVGDVERAEKLGALELEEEDLGLCAFVCPGKLDHQAALRKTLDQIHKEG